MASTSSTSSIPSSPIPPHKLKIGDKLPSSTHHKALVGPQGLAQSSAEWEVKALEIPPPTGSTIAQHVDAEIRKVDSNSSAAYKVQLNLSHYSLPSSSLSLIELFLFLGGFRSTYPEVDAGYFHAYRDLQGRDLMICYGAYAMNLGGVRVIATIVEDALSRTATLAEWAKYMLQITGSSEPIIKPSRKSLQTVEFTPSSLRVKIESDFALVRRVLRIEPRFCPVIEIGKAALGPATTHDSLRYILRFVWSSRSISYMKSVLEIDYRDYCASNKNKQSPVFKSHDFSLHLPGLFMMDTERPISKAVTMSSSVPSLQSSSPTSISSSLPPLSLKAGDTFTIRGPSIYRDITAPEHYPLPAPDSSHPPRPLIPELVGTNGLAQASASWEVKVTKSYEAGPADIMQTAEGKVQRVGSSESYPVHVFLSYSSLPSIGQYKWWDQVWLTEDLFIFNIETVVAHYHTYRALQGREIPICYGLFSTKIKGTDVRVLVSEKLDNSSSGKLATWANLARIFYPSEEIVIGVQEYKQPEVLYTASMLRIKMTEDLKTLRRFLNCEPRFLPNLTGPTVLGSSSHESIHYLHTISCAPRLTQAVEQDLRRCFTEYCRSKLGTGRPTLKLENFERYLPGLLFLASTASYDLVDSCIPHWEKLLFIMRYFAMLDQFGMAD
ncbi:hypothetical protein JCM5350_001842 [Sporobolomyces pararoseus]